MTRRNQAPHGPDRGVPQQALTREESRYLDGEASPEEVRRMEHQLAADPVRAARLSAWQEAMGLWRADAARAAAVPGLEDGVAAEGLADRILAAGPQAGRLRNGRSLSAAPWYAAAAALLMTVGVTGTLLTRANARGNAGAMRPPQVGSLSDGVMDDMVDGPELLPGLASTKEGR